MEKLNSSFPNITVQNNSGAISGKFMNTKCADIYSKIPSLLLTTEYEKGLELQLDPTIMLFDSHDDTCNYGFSILHNSSQGFDDRLLLGH